MYTRTSRKNKEKEEVRLEEFICNLKNTERFRYFKIQAPKKREILMPLSRAIHQQIKEE